MHVRLIGAEASKASDFSGDYHIMLLQPLAPLTLQMTDNTSGNSNEWQ
jgi:hypothetical protein